MDILPYVGDSFGDETAFLIVMQFGIEVLYKMSRANVNVVKFGSVTILLCLRAQMNFYLHVLYFVTDLDEIRYRSSTRTC